LIIALVVLAGMLTLSTLEVLLSRAELARHLTQSPPFSTSVRLAVQNERVRQALGRNLEIGFFVHGEIEQDEEGAGALLRIPLSGARDKGVVDVVAVRQAGEWELKRVVVEVDDGFIDLLPAGSLEFPREFNDYRVDFNVGSDLSQPVLKLLPPSPLTRIRRVLEGPVDESMPGSG
jgi:hypothetical protein